MMPSGIQFHSRSLLVWGERLDAEAMEAIHTIAWTGARILVLDGPLAGTVGAGLTRTVLDLWVATDLDSRDGGIGDDPPTPSEWMAMSSLWRRSGLTPLGPSARTSVVWQHSMCELEGTIAGSASRQTLRYPVGGFGVTELLCCVAVEPRCRRRGLGRRCVEGVAPASGPATVILEPGNPSAELFAKMSFKVDGHAYLYEHR